MSSFLTMLMVAVLTGLLFAIWWIPRSIRIQRIEFAMQQGKDAIAELQLQIKNGDIDDVDEAKKNIASLHRVVQRLKAKL